MLWSRYSILAVGVTPTPAGVLHVCEVLGQDKGRLGR